MKITTTTPKNYTELCYIESGEIFSPTNSQHIYMKLYNETCDDCWNECESRLFDFYENPQNHEIVDIIRETRPCVDMVTGEIVFFHEDLRVVKVNYEFIIKGE